MAALSGMPTDGGFGTVDAASHPVRAAGTDQFMFSGGPSNRSVYEAFPSGVRGMSALPGGISGVLGTRQYFNLLPDWLANVAYNQLFDSTEVQKGAVSEMKLVPIAK
jgi:penicillin amidase